MTLRTTMMALFACFALGCSGDDGSGSGDDDDDGNQSCAALFECQNGVCECDDGTPCDDIDDCDVACEVCQ